MTAPALTATGISYAELIQRIQHGGPLTRMPLQGSVELTYRCNLVCTHCWVNLPAGDRAARARELTADELKRITDEIVEAGGLWMLLTGGEIFLRPDFFDVYLHMKRQGLLLTLFSNGVAITPRVAERLAEYPPTKVEISLYGITPETYRAVTNVDALNRCLRGIRLLLDRGIKVKLKSVVTTANYDEFLVMAAYAREEFGLIFAYDPNLNYRKVEGREGMHPATVRVPPEKIVALDVALDEDSGDLKKFHETRRRAISEHVFTCGAGLNTYHIDPYGRLSSCMMVPNVTYDLRAGSFREGWDSFLDRVVNLKKSRITRCGSCAISATCDVCPGWSVLEHGEFERPVDYLCELNHRRQEVFETAALIPTIARKGVADG